MLPPSRLALTVFLALATAAVALYASMGRSFTSLAPGFAQHLWAVSSLKSGTATLSGVVVLQNGTVVSIECRSTTTTQLHWFDPTVTSTKNDTLLHKETVGPSIPGGCGIAYLNVGGQDYIFSNINDASTSDGDGIFGVVRIAWPSMATTKMAANFPGNWLGIAVDPQKNDLQTNDLIYAGASCRPQNPQPQFCTIYRFNPITGVVSTFASLPGAQFAFIDGVSFDPSGNYLFLTNRTASPAAGELDVLDRSGQVRSRTVIANAEPMGMAVHASPMFVVTNNTLDTSPSNIGGTVTRYDFPGDDFSQAPSTSLFASGGFRGDLVQVGPDGCLYLTQLRARYNNGLTDDNNSIVQICGGFVPPPGITLNPAPPPSSLCGFVYNDANDNGAKETGEAAIGGVTVNLSGRDFLDLPVTASTTTSSTDGSYCFNNLAAGTYSISEVQPNAYLDGIDTQGAPGNGTPGNDSFNNISLAAGFNGNNNNFGELKASWLAGYVYVDKDNDGKREEDKEPGIAGVGLTLTGTDDRGNAVNTTGGTGTDGAYKFAQLRPGTYTITETQPAGFLDGKDTIGTPGGTGGNDVFSNIVLPQNFNGENNNFGELPATPAITLQKKTNGTTNAKAPGLYVAAGSVVTWTYVLTNTGNDLLSSIVVTDDKVGAITCPASTLGVGLSITCTATGTAIAGQYTNVGTVTAQDALGTVVTASDIENYFGTMPGIAITTMTNGTDNDAAPGPTLAIGSTVTWTYAVTNTGNVTLSNVAITDDPAGAVTCPSKTLAVLASMTCTKTGTAVAGQYTNVGTATGTDPTGAMVTASNADHYFGATPTLTIVTKTNGSDNDSPTGPILPVGAAVTWTYTVTNTGNVPFSNVVVTDSKTVVVTCPAGTLDVGASFTCTAAGTAIAGQYTNIGTASATSVAGTTTASNPDNYFGAAPAIGIVTRTNGVDNDSGAGLMVPAGSIVGWTYVVTNRGNIALSSVAVSDDKLGAVTCPATTLAVAASMTCTMTGVAVSGPYANLGTASGVDVTGATVMAANPDGYFGSSPSIAIVTQTNGTNNDTPPGPSLAAGTTVNWTYLVSNTGNVALSNVVVTDNKGSGISCPGTTLALGGTMTCTRSAAAVAGQYTNVGTATAKDPIGTVVTASNPDNYFGVSSAISIVTKTNGSDNDAGPGPAILAGSAVNWTYVVTNTGNVALTQVAVIDDKVGPAACPANTLAPGASITCTAAGIAAVGSYTNIGTATAVDTLGRAVSAQNVDHYVGVEPPASDLAISMTGPNSGTAGASGLLYSIAVANNGPSTVNSPVVTVPLPAGMTMATVGAVPAGWTCSTAAASPTALICAKASMAIGETAALTFTTQLACPFPNPSPAVVNIVATASSSTDDPFPANNSAAVPLSVVNLPPTINGLSVDNAVLWPPNHKMVPIVVSYTITPACGGAPTVGLAVVSNEGDSSDWKIKDPHHLDLRSERLGTQKEGRVYTITVTATDSTGTSSQKNVTVTVPHDQGHGK